MKHFLKLCILLFIALFFIACKNAAGPNVPSENLEGDSNEVETTPDTPNTEDETGSGSSSGSEGTGDSSESGTGESGGSPGGSTGDTGTGGTNEGGTGSGNDNGSDNEVIIPDGYTIIPNSDLAIDLNNKTGHTIVAYLLGKVSGNWNIVGGNFNGESPALTLDTNTYDYSQIKGIIEQAVYFEHTTATSAYENVIMDSTKITESKAGVTLIVTLQANEYYIFEDGKSTKDIHIIFDIVVQ